MNIYLHPSRTGLEPVRYLDRIVSILVDLDLDLDPDPDPEDSPLGLDPDSEEKRSLGPGPGSYDQMLVCRSKTIAPKFSSHKQISSLCVILFLPLLLDLPA